MKVNKYLQSIGKILVRDNGKQKYYSNEQVRKSHAEIDKNTAFNTLELGAELLELSCSLFSTKDEFIKNFDLDLSDYFTLKAKAVKELSNSSSYNWESFTEFDLDISWLEVGDLFESIGAFINEIFTALE